MRAVAAALELRGEQQMLLQLFSSPLAAACRARSAGSTLVKELKEHRNFDSKEPFSSGLRIRKAHRLLLSYSKERTDGIA